jgi:hypothetical protein
MHARILMVHSSMAVQEEGSSAQSVQNNRKRECPAQKECRSSLQQVSARQTQSPLHVPPTVTLLVTLDTHVCTVIKLCILLCSLALSGLPERPVLEL